MARRTLEPNVVRAELPARPAIDLVADKWSALAIVSLAQGAQRYPDLQRRIDGVSRKMLTRTLRRLERDGLVQRTACPGFPPRVEYSLTPLGHTLESPLRMLCEWAQDHLLEVLLARGRHAQGKATLAPHLGPDLSKAPNGDQPGRTMRSAAVASPSA